MFNVAIRRIHERRSVTLSRDVAVLATLAMVFGMSFSSPIAASAAPTTGSISGTVTSSSTSGAIGGVQVSAWGTNYGTTTTDALGHYTIEGLSPGSYRVQFSAQSLNYVSEYWDGSASYETASLVGVTAGSAVAGINAELADGASISGNVRGEGSPPINLANVQVEARPDWGLTGLVGASAMTDVDGNFTITGLAAGEYQLSFGTLNVPSFAPVVRADLITLEEGDEVSGIQALLAVGSKITGQVSGEANPLVGLEGVSVSVQGEDLASLPYYSNWAETNADGEYSLEGLPSGTYTLTTRVDDSLGLNFLDESKVLTISSGETASQNVLLDVGGTVSGNVTAGGAPIEGIQVAIRSDHYWRWTDVTDEDGNYTIDRLPTGSYPVRFSDETNAPMDAFATQWWSGSVSESGSTSVDVVAGEPTTGVDAALAQGSTISGHIAYESGDPVPYPGLFVWDAYGDPV